jgi:hypothetical protein
MSPSRLLLNEIAWSPGDPGTGAPSFFLNQQLKGRPSGSGDSHWRQWRAAIHGGGILNRQNRQKSKTAVIVAAVS